MLTPSLPSPPIHIVLSLGHTRLKLSAVEALVNTYSQYIHNNKYYLNAIQMPSHNSRQIWWDRKEIHELKEVHSKGILCIISMRFHHLFHLIFFI